MLIHKADVGRYLLVASLIATVAALAAGGWGQAAGHHSADLDKLAGAYKASYDSLKNKNHKDSKYVVFKTKTGYGIGFKQPTGQYRGSILCFEASVAADGKSLFCEVDRPGCAEMLKIGLPDSDLCKDKSYNKCKNGGNACACFVIEHVKSAARDDAGKARKQQSTDDVNELEIMCPPGNGAGSGGSH